MTDTLDGTALPPDHTFARRIEVLLGELVEHQERRLVALGRRLYPELSRDDLHNFDDVPLLAGDPHFAYEDGHYAGLLAAQMAVRALLRQQGSAGGLSPAPGPERPEGAIVPGPDDCAR